MNYTLKNEYLTAVISDIGGQTLSLSDHSGKEYIWHADPAIWEDHAPLLFPSAERSRTDAIPTAARPIPWMGKASFRSSLLR